MAGLLETYRDVNLVDRLRAKVREADAATRPRARSEIEVIDAAIIQA